MFSPTYHPIQARMLIVLRLTESVRYSELLRASQADPEAFLYHVRKLQRTGTVVKSANGLYSLTRDGKSLANLIDDPKEPLRAQPKQTLILVAPRFISNDEKNEYAVQKRERNPFWGFWGFPCAPVRLNEPFETTASKELLMQTGLIGSPEVAGVCRNRDFDEAGQQIEDSLFVIVKFRDVHGQLNNDWPGATSSWMDSATLLSKGMVFGGVSVILDMLDTNTRYTTCDNILAAHMF